MSVLVAIGLLLPALAIGAPFTITVRDVRTKRPIPGAKVILYPHSGEWNECREPRLAQVFAAGEEQRTDAKGRAEFTRLGIPAEPPPQNCPPHAPCIAPRRAIPYQAYAVFGGKRYLPVYAELPNESFTEDLVSAKAKVRSKAQAMRIAAKYFAKKGKPLDYHPKEGPEHSVCLRGGRWWVTVFAGSDEYPVVTIDPYTGKLTSQ